MSTITLNDPQTGEAVTLVIPEDCPRYFKLNGDSWFFWIEETNPFWIIDDQTSEVRIPIIAAVAKEWFEGKAEIHRAEMWDLHANPKNLYNNDKHDLMSIELRNAEEFESLAKAWRRFTCKPTPAPQERRA